MKTIIETPAGYKKVEKEIDGNTVISFNPIEVEVEVPKSWEDFCKKSPVTGLEYYITVDSGINGITNSKRGIYSGRNFISTEKRAEAMLAFMQLIRVRDYVNGGWIPDWDNIECKYTIINHLNYIYISSSTNESRPLAFRTKKTRDLFLNNFLNLIEQAQEFI